MVPDNSWNCPSIELILVLRVEMDPVDLSSELDGLDECAMVEGMENGDGAGEVSLLGDHFFAV